MRVYVYPLYRVAGRPAIVSKSVQVDSLAAKHTKWVKVGPFPALLSNVKLVVVVDVANQVHEANESNNTFTKVVENWANRPDLTITAATCTKTQVQVTVRNIGPLATTKICRLRVAVFSGEYKGGKHEFDCYAWVSPMKAGETRVVTLANPHTLPSGVIWLNPYVDDTNLIAERKETNNTFPSAKVLP